MYLKHHLSLLIMTIMGRVRAARVLATDIISTPTRANSSKTLLELRSGGGKRRRTITNIILDNTDLINDSLHKCV